MNYTLKLIIDDINRTLERLPNYNKIIVTEDNINELSFYLLIFIGTKEEHTKINNKNKKYYGIGIYELYVEDEIDEELIEYCKKQGVVITYSDENIDSLIYRVNEKTSGYAASLMSRNSEHIKKFMREVKTSSILINISPLLEEQINIEIQEVIKKKRTVTYSK